MKSIAIMLCIPGEEIEALKATAKSIREGYGAGSLVKVGAPYFHNDSDFVGSWTSIPSAWEVMDQHILIESDKDLCEYELASLVESKITNY